MTMMEKARLMAATRQFDGALDSFENIAGDAAIAQKQPFEWAYAVREAFTIAVRVKHDPNRALQIVDKVLALPEIPSLFKDMMPNWKKSIEAWKAEPVRELVTEEDKYQEANRLYQAARTSQGYWHDRSGDILYLRFSLAVHELLSRYPNGKHAGEALLMAGTAYQLLDDWLISPLPELYFEACVRKVPHSEIAHQCFLRVEEGIYFGYTGSAGTNIPSDIRTTLRELQLLAAPSKGR